MLNFPYKIKNCANLWQITKIIFVVVVVVFVVVFCFVLFCSILFGCFLFLFFFCFALVFFFFFFFFFCNKMESFGLKLTGLVQSYLNKGVNWWQQIKGRFIAWEWDLNRALMWPNIPVSSLYWVSTSRGNAKVYKASSVTWGGAKCNWGRC